MKRPLFLSAVAAAALLVPAVSQAQPPEAAPPARQFGRDARRPGAPAPGRAMADRRSMAAELGLTDAQKTDLQKNREAVRRDRLRKTTDLRIARMDLKSLLRAEKVDEKAVSLKLAEVQAAQGALVKLKVDSVLAMKRILTPEQQKMIMDMRGRRAGMKRMMNQNRRGMRSPGDRGRNRGRMGGAMGPGADASDLDLDLDGDDPGPAPIR